MVILNKFCRIKPNKNINSACPVCQTSTDFYILPQSATIRNLTTGVRSQDPDQSATHATPPGT